MAARVSGKVNNRKMETKSCGDPPLRIKIESLAFEQNRTLEPLKVRAMRAKLDPSLSKKLMNPMSSTKKNPPLIKTKNEVLSV